VPASLPSVVLIAGVALLPVTACDSSPRTLENSIASARVREARPPCPADELSCGLQRPVLSDGIQPFRNDEMGLQAAFPAGSRVCRARSGDAPRGFYAWYGTTRTDCPERGDIAATRMAISAMYNAVSHREVRDAVGTCDPLSHSLFQALGGEPLAIRGHRSLLCQSDASDGDIEIWVYAMAGRLPDDAPDDPPAVIYSASLETSPARWERDLPMFRTFLNAVRIGIGDVSANPAGRK
jgi:hypothetical protein